MKLGTVVFSVAAIRTEKRETPAEIKREITLIKAGSIKRRICGGIGLQYFCRGERTSWQVKKDKNDTPCLRLTNWRLRRQSRETSADVGRL